MAPRVARQKTIIETLAPFSTAALYQSVRVYDNLTLELLASTILGNLSHRELVSSLGFFGDGDDDGGDDEDENDPYIRLLGRSLENMIISLHRLKHLEACDWHLVGKVVLAGGVGGFGNLGGKELATIKLEDSFNTLTGPVSVALSNLRKLPQLIAIEYVNYSPIKEEGLIFSEIGFAKVTSLTIKTPFPSLPSTLDPSASFHAVNVASLFPAVVKLELVQSKFDEAPDFAPFLATIQPGSVTSIDLNTSPNARYTIEAHTHSIHHLLKRFTSLSQLSFLDRRRFDGLLVQRLSECKLLTYLSIDASCKISPSCLDQLLSEINRKDSRTGLTLNLRLPMQSGHVGVSYKDGAEARLEKGVLVPGNDWKRPGWNKDAMTREEGIELVALAKKQGVKFYGSISMALKVEKAFEEEEKWLKDGMDVLRIGRAASNIWRAEG